MMSSSLPTVFLFRNPCVSVCLEGTNGILFHADAGREKVLNHTALWLWNAMDGVKSLDRLAVDLARHYEQLPSPEIAGDVRAIVLELLQEGYIFMAESPRTGPVEPEVYSRIHEAPRSFDLSLTGRCNLHCAYCFYADEMAGRKDLPGSAWQGFFGELGTLAVRSLTLSGGELFMRGDLWELVDSLIHARMRYSVLTNGTLVTEKTLEGFGGGLRRIRLDSIQVSIDGSCAAVHDASRGAGSFEKAIRGLRLLKEAGFPVTARITVNRHNAGDLENTARLLLDEIGLNRIGTNDAIPMGTGCALQESIVLTPSQRVQAMRTLVKLEQVYPGRIQATAGSLALWHMFREMEEARATGVKTKRWKMGCLSSCGCMFAKLAVHHDGMIVPCNMLAAASLGRIGETSIRSIWQDHPLLKEMRTRSRISMEEVPGCAGCEWTPYCSGGCPAAEYTRTGEMNVANPECCYRRFLAECGELP